MGKNKRRFFIIAASVIALILFLQLLISLFGDRYAGRRLKRSVQKASGHKYMLQYDDLDFGFLSGTVEFDNLRLVPDSAKADTSVQSRPGITLKIDCLQINGISLWRYLLFNQLSMDSISLDKPVLKINPEKWNSGQKQKKQKKAPFVSIDSSLYVALPKPFKSLSVNQFSIHNGQFLLEKKTAPGDSSLWASNINLRLRDIRVDSASARSGRLFITNNIEFKIGEYGQHISGDLYRFSAHNFSLSSDSQLLSADSIQFIPRYPKYEFSRRHGTEIDRITIKIPHARISGIDINQSINSRHFYAKSAKIAKPRVEVFHDKSMPSPPPHGPVPLPNVTFKQMNTKIKLDTLNINDGYISYSEQKAKLSKAGTVHFDDLSATISGISNYDADLNDKYVVKMKTHSNVMGTGPLNVNFSFPMGDNAGHHHIEGTLGSIDATNFNEATEYMALVRISDGIMHHLNFSMDLNTYGAQGSLTADYEHLKVEMLKIKNQQPTGEKTIQSFIANNFIVRGSNHKPPLGKAAIRFKREEPKSIFNLWWKGLLSGLKEQLDLF